jgi:thiol-disulfide isomerase/thioredoxin
MAATDLDDKSFTKTLAATPLAVVDFHAGWCGPCIMFKPKFKRIAGDYPEVGFFMVDGEKSPKARKTVTIDALPYFAVYKDGAFVEGISTDQEEVFRAFLEKHRGGGAA